MAEGFNPRKPPKADAALITAIERLLRVNAPATALAPRVATLVRPLGLNRRAVASAVGLAMSRPIHLPVDVDANATKETAETEYLYRAAYILAAARRLHRALRSGKVLRQAMVAERDLFNRHLQAQARRHHVATVVDRTASKRKGKRLGWYAVLDNRTSPECRAAHGRNFEIDRRPPIGYPGSVHPSCRCRPGPPHRTRQTVYDIPARRSA